MALEGKEVGIVRGEESGKARNSVWGLEGEAEWRQDGRNEVCMARCPSRPQDAVGNGSKVSLSRTCRVLPFLPRLVCLSYISAAASTAPAVS